MPSDNRHEGARRYLLPTTIRRPRQQDLSLRLGQSACEAHKLRTTLTVPARLYPRRIVLADKATLCKLMEPRGALRTFWPSRVKSGRNASELLSIVNSVRTNVSSDKSNASTTSPRYMTKWSITCIPLSSFPPAGNNCSLIGRPPKLTIAKSDGFMHARKST